MGRGGKRPGAGRKPGKDKKTGQFLPGNKFWEARSSHGRSPIFAAPDDLWSAAVEYFEWVEANPLYEEKVFNGKDGVVRASVAKMRAMTISGLCVFLDIGRRTWDEYRDRPDFLPVVTRAEEIIRDQKFAGAAADLLNASIIARDLGLADKSEFAGDPKKPLKHVHVIERRIVRPDDPDS